MLNLVGLGGMYWTVSFGVYWTESLSTQSYRSNAMEAKRVDKVVSDDAAEGGGLGCPCQKRTLGRHVTYSLMHAKVLEILLLLLPSPFEQTCGMVVGR
jgi:hypothetical protein